MVKLVAYFKKNISSQLIQTFPTQRHDHVIPRRHHQGIDPEFGTTSADVMLFVFLFLLLPLVSRELLSVVSVVVDKFSQSDKLAVRRTAISKEGKAYIKLFRKARRIPEGCSQT